MTILFLKFGIKYYCYFLDLVTLFQCSSITIVAHAVCLIFLYKLEAWEKLPQTSSDLSDIPDNSYSKSLGMNLMLADLKLQSHACELILWGTIRGIMFIEWFVDHWWKTITDVIFDYGKCLIDYYGKIT